MGYREVRQISAGGVIVRRKNDRHEACLILRDRHGQPAWGLPKGHLESGEDKEAAALREAKEETGLIPQILAPLGSISYSFTKNDDPSVCLKTVHFFLMRSVGGDLSRHDAEVLKAEWMPIERAIAQATHDNERHIITEAGLLLSHAEINSALCDDPTTP